MEVDIAPIRDIENFNGYTIDTQIWKIKYEKRILNAD